MRSFYSISAFVLLYISTIQIGYSCTATTQYPNNTITTDSTSLAAVTVSTCNYPGEYAVVILQGNYTYTFESTVNTDFFEITDLANNTIDTGTGSVLINNNGTDTVRMHIFSNSSCGTSSTCRTTTVTRQPCLSTNQFPTYIDTAGTNYDTHFVSYCNTAGQYFDIVLYAGRYEVTSSDTNDIFVFTDTLNSLYFAQQTPVLANVTAGNFLLIRVHIFSNAACGTDTICRAIGVRRLPCIATSQYPTTTFQTSNDPAPDTITNCNYGGEYIVMNVNAGETYEVSSDSSDWFVLTHTDDTYLSNGPSAFTFTNPYGDTTLRVHIFLDDACTEASVCRQTYVRCTTCPVPVPTIVPSDSVACTNELPVTLTATNAFSGEIYWFSGSCGSTPIDSGTSIQVSPSTSTMFYCANSYEGEISMCDSFFLPVFASPSVSITSVTNILCHGEEEGAATASGSGGQNPYSFLWSNGADSITNDEIGSGQYIVTLTDNNGCHAFDTTTITEPTSIEDSAVVITDLLCFNDEIGSITHNIVGGTSPYDYQWSNTATSANISSQAGGTYTLTVTDDNECEKVFTYEISSPDTLTNNLEVDDVWCKGDTNGAAAAQAIGGTPGYSYQWSISVFDSNLVDIPEGTYNLKITDANGCIILDTAEVSYTHENPVISMDSTDIICADKILTLDAGSGFSYAWSTNESSQTIDINAAGLYTVTVTDFNGCSSEHTITIEQDSCLGIGSIGLINDVSIFPNPTERYVQFQIHSLVKKQYTVRLLSIDGSTINTFSYAPTTLKDGIDMSMLPNGVYLIEFEFESTINRQRIVLQAK